MDVESLLDYFDGILTQTALSRLTGINIKQLNHYARGKSKPRPAQIRKIEQGLHKLGVELMEINL
jgi:transcriptional regulator with XRE-family HTH domain